MAKYNKLPVALVQEKNHGDAEANLAIIEQRVAEAAASGAKLVTVTADPAECSFQFNPTGTVKFTSSCDIAKQRLAGASVSYDNIVAPAGTSATIHVGETLVKVKYTPEDIAAAKAKADAKRVEVTAGCGCGRVATPGRCRVLRSR